MRFPILKTDNCGRAPYAGQVMDFTPDYSYTSNNGESGGKISFRDTTYQKII